MELVKLTPEEFKQIAKIIYARTGIHLPDSKLTLLSNRLRRRLRALQLETFGDYYRLLRNERKCQDELPHFLSAVTTNETYFFRNEHLWKYFCEEWIPGIVERKGGSATKSIRIWSAASSSGEEAYTAAMCLREGIPYIDSWRVNVIGSDISQRILDRAKRGEYNDYAVSRTSRERLGMWFDTEDKIYRLKPVIRKMASFQFHNLRDPFPNARFDLIFLRNVLMYFDVTMKKQALRTVFDALVPGGHLVVGDVDPIRNRPELNEVLKLNYLGPNLYQKPDSSTASRVGPTSKTPQPASVQTGGV